MARAIKLQTDWYDISPPSMSSFTRPVILRSGIMAQAAFFCLYQNPLTFIFPSTGY